MTNSFEEAISDARTLLQCIKAGLPPDHAVGEIQGMLSEEVSARGFFVALLTSEGAVADAPPPYLVEALRSAPEVAHTLLAKNLVMSTATKLVHQRNEDIAAAEGSSQVAERTKNLLKAMKSEAANAQLREMMTALSEGTGSLAKFAARMNYDEEQKAVALGAIREVLVMT